MSPSPAPLSWFTLGLLSLTRFTFFCGVFDLSVVTGIIFAVGLGVVPASARESLGSVVLSPDNVAS